MNDLVSIIMPAFNAANTINESILSVYTQDYLTWELLIINDGSSDHTEEVILKWVEQDKRIIYIKNDENKGVSYSRNLGMKIAKGEWISFLDSDDLWTKDKLSIQLHLMIKKKSLFSFTGTSFIDNQGNPYPGFFEVKEDLKYNDLLRHNSIACSSTILHRSLIKFASFKGDAMSEDFASWLNILRELKTCTGINKPLLIYRISKQSKSGNKFKSAFMGYKAYRQHGLGVLLSMFYLFNHLFNSVKKYKKIGLVRSDS